MQDWYLYFISSTITIVFITIFIAVHYFYVTFIFLLSLPLLLSLSLPLLLLLSPLSQSSFLLRFSYIVVLTFNCLLFWDHSEKSLFSRFCVIPATYLPLISRKSSYSFSSIFTISFIFYVFNQELTIL